MLDREKAEATVCHVVGLLAAGDYRALEQLSGGGLSAHEVRQSVEDYGRSVLPSPFEMGEPVAVTGPRAWAVDMDLHTAEEGRSDLTLSLTLLDDPGPLYGVRLDDLHVL